MALPVQDAAYPTPSQVRDTLLSAIRFYYARIGVVRNVLPGSDDYERLGRLASRVSLAITNNQIAAQNSNPLKAVGVPLTQLAAIFGVYPRPASGGAGSVLPSFQGANVTIPSSWTGTATNGKKYLATAGTYATGVLIPVQAVSTGSDTNQVAGAVITWDSGAIFLLAPLATVATGGITGGVSADGDEELRSRLLERLASSAGGGNASFVVAAAENASASVEKAYNFSAARGAGSWNVALTKKGPGNRVLDNSIVTSVQSTVLAAMPGQSSGLFTSVTPEYADIVMIIDLPLPELAGGAGGGFRDQTPWPNGAGNNVKITAYSSGTATCNGSVAPQPGNQIGIWDYSYIDPATGEIVGQMIEYSIVNTGGSPGAFTFTVQNGFQVTGSLVGSYISTGATSLVQYANTYRDQVGTLGPGEITLLPELLPRASRQPPPDVVAPANITDRLKAAVEDAYSEILDLQYSLRVAAGTGTPLTSPSIPATTGDPPHVLVLKNLSFKAA